MNIIDSLSVVAFRGRDVRQFLHNQLSSDIRNTQQGQGQFSCICNPAGRVLFPVLVCPSDEDLLLICSSSLAGDMVQWLSKFVFREDVKIYQEEELVVSVPGGVDPGTLLDIHEESTGLDYRIAHRSDDVDGEPAVVLAWKQAELKQGVTWLNQETTASYLPQMLGYERIGALSFNKGCYPGQEIIARTRYLGKLKRRPVLIRIEDMPEAVIDARVELACADEKYSANIVDIARGNDHDMLVLLVMRAQEDIQPDMITVGESSRKVLPFS